MGFFIINYMHSGWCCDVIQGLTTKLNFIYRKTLGFWAGHRNSKIRVILAHVWENDTELYILNNRINRATEQPLAYQKRFYKTKFCICPGGSQVNSARIADSIHYGCVPGEFLNSLNLVWVLISFFFVFFLFFCLFAYFVGCFVEYVAYEAIHLLKSYAILCFPFLMSQTWTDSFT